MFFEMRAEGRNFSTVDLADTGRVAWGKVTQTHTDTQQVVVLAGVQCLTVSQTQGDRDQIYINEASACLIC